MDEIMRVTTDPKAIIEWAEKHGGKPQVIEVKDDENMPGIRLDFPGKKDDRDLPPGKVRNITWEEFFDLFEKERLAFMYVDNLDTTDTDILSYAYRFIKRDELKNRTEDGIKELLDAMFEDFKNRR
jgi:hypothetical protein